MPPSGAVTLEVWQSTAVAVSAYGVWALGRVDNGVPFASPNFLFGLSKLSVWWRLRLGIEIECIQPSHPEQNGRHKRMHLTLNVTDVVGKDRPL